MRRKVLSVAVVVALCVATLCPTEPVLACGPFFPSVIFTSTEFPGVPLRRFVAGELGILQPTFSRKYLFTGYRYLNGDPLEPREREAVLTLARIDDSDGHNQSNNVPASKKWLMERAQVPGVTPIKAIDSDRMIQITRHAAGAPDFRFYDSYANCLDSAFDTASATLKKRIGQFGVRSIAVREWVKAQDAVFRNCGGKEGPAQAILPDATDTSLPEIIREDNKYQTAAAHFYAGEFDEAGALFQEISGEKQSQWRAIASLLVARSLIRKATINGGEEGFAEKTLRQAEAVLEKIIADPALEEVHQGAERLQGFVQIRLDPLTRKKLLAQRLGKAGDPNFLQDLIDFTISADGEEAFPGIKTVMSNQLNIVHASVEPITDWMNTFQASDEQSRAHALDRWLQTRSLAWLVAAIVKSKSSDAETEQLISTARRIDVGSPGYLTVTFHRLRLEAASGQRDLARQELDTLLAGKHSHWSRSDQNLLLALRMSLAQNLEELLKFSVRVGARYLPYGEDYDPPQPIVDDAEIRKNEKEAAGPYFDSDGAWILTRGLPTDLLIRAVEGNVLPRDLRRRVAESAWVRSVELEDDANAIRLAPIIGKLEPLLAADMKEYGEASDVDSRRFAASLTILRMPGLRPYVGPGISRTEHVQTMDRYGNNWWCGLADSELFVTNDASERPRLFDQIYVQGQITYPAFLKEEQRTAAKEEWSRLLAEETGTQALAKKALSSAKAHPADSRVPESLHMAVRALRYGCGRDGSSKYSKEAFDLLHRRYPKSEWTKKTPYWF